MPPSGIIRKFFTVGPGQLRGETGMTRKLGKVTALRTMAVNLIASVGLVTTAIVVPTLVMSTPAAAASPCTAPVVNPVACENTQAGTPNWQVNTDDPSITGFTTDISSTAG